MNCSKESWIILGFALLHAAVALGCRLAGLTDDMILTLLTMLLVVILCLRSSVSGAFMAVSAVVVNIMGVLLGRGTAWLFSQVLDSPLSIYPLSTFISTEIIGWISLWAARRYARMHPAASMTDAGSLKWLLAAFVLILVTRLAILLLDRGGVQGRNLALSILLDYSLTLVVVVALAAYALGQQRRALEASEQANLAQYRYHTLKQQVNPHFLFNSLNVLDYLILEQPREDASRYTHQLADVYRYMIKSEDETTVPLRDEMAFVEKYADLQGVRFPEGLDVNVDIPEAAMSRAVVPCCVQLLVENAIKHNIIRADEPLQISIRVEDDNVVVSNNRIPKLTKPVSTGLGLKYIRQQYQDLAGKSVTILEEERRYTVKIPLL